MSVRSSAGSSTRRRSSWRVTYATSSKVSSPLNVVFEGEAEKGPF
jgi:hypothetical protein